MKETNMEHYRGEIEAADYKFAVVNGKIVRCELYCDNCRFFDGEGLGACTANRIKWLMSEYKPEPVLTAREKCFVEFVQKGWLARDKCCGIYHYFDKPTKERATWEVDGCAVVYLNKFGDNLFPFITWEDEEPWAVEELRKLKVKAGDQDA